MFYREAGQFKASYEADQAIFPIVQDRFVMLALLAIAFIVVPFVASEYVYRAVLIPTVILALAAIGLNVLMGYCGQVSFGHAAFFGIAPREAAYVDPQHRPDGEILQRPEHRRICPGNMGHPPGAGERVPGVSQEGSGAARPAGVLIPIPSQSPLFVGSSSSAQRTNRTPRSLNPRRLDIILGLELVLFMIVNL